MTTEQVFRTVVGLPDDPTTVDADAFREAMGSFPAAVSVITALDADETPRGLTCSAFCSLSAEPPLVLACVNQRNGSLQAIRHSGGFVVNLLRAGSHDVSARFASPVEDKYDGVAWEPSPESGLPRLSDDASAHLDCRLVADIAAGSHAILIGGIRTCGSEAHERCSPLLYWRRAYGSWSAADDPALNPDGNPGAEGGPTA